MKKRLFFLYILVILCMSACNKGAMNQQEILPTTIIPSQTLSEPTKTLDEIAPISLTDFDVMYQGLLLNSNISLKEIDKVLNLNLLEGDNIQYKASSIINDQPYQWNKLHYPNEDEEEIKIEYVINKNDGSGRIVYIDLEQNPTSRDVRVGDSKEKIKEKYGDLGDGKYNTEETMWYEIVYDTYTLAIIYDKNTEKITKISIDYDTNQMMEDMDITSFD